MWWPSQVVIIATRMPLIIDQSLPSASPRLTSLSMSIAPARFGRLPSEPSGGVGVPRGGPREAMESQRIAALNDRPEAGDGRYVLYWMQQAQRAATNHAL